MIIKNFDYIYNLLKNYNFYYIEDIIVNYIELFEFDYEAVNYAILNIKSELGEDFVKIIGNNLTIINDIIGKATDY